MAKIHLEGKYISYEERQANSYLNEYEHFHGYCGYLQKKQRDKKSYTQDLNKVTCKRCLKAVVKNRNNPIDTN